MEKISFNPEKELQSGGFYSSFYPTGPSLFGVTKVPSLTYPISPKENLKLLLDRKDPLWMPAMGEVLDIDPYDFADNRARSFVREVKALQPEEQGGKDWFGVDWVFSPSAGGSMVAPGNPKVKDITKWEEYITFPDLSKIDFKAIAERNKELLSERDRMISTTQFTGLFERLISFVDFENAALAMIDEDEQEAVHRLFDRLCVFYDEIIGLSKEHFDIDILTFHDDWGSQRAPFFSLDTCREMLVPYLSRIVESCHKRGIIFHFHSCGKNELLVPAMIEAGVDFWVPQPMNDTCMLIEKYGDKLIFGAGLRPDPSANMREEAQKFADKYSGNKSILCFLMGAPSTESELYTSLYSITRERYCN